MTEIIEELRKVAALETAAFGSDGPVSVIESQQETAAADAYRQAAYNLGHADLLKTVVALQVAAAPAPLADAELVELDLLMRVANPRPCYIYDDSDKVTTSLYLSPDPSGQNKAGTYTDFANFTSVADAHLVQVLYAKLPSLLTRLAKVEALAATDDEKEWISVDERLPEPGVDVLICEHRDDCAMNIAQYLPDEVDEEDTDKWEYGYGEWGTPSFWRPLPAQPVQKQAALCAKLSDAAPTQVAIEGSGSHE